MQRCKEIKTTEELQNTIQDAKEKRDVLIFKYSPICPISRSAEDEFDHWVQNNLEQEKYECIKIDVISSKALSKEVADMFGVTHQSPQILWLNKAQEVKWHNSHYGISSKALSNQL